MPKETENKRAHERVKGKERRCSSVISHVRSHTSDLKCQKSFERVLDVQRLKERALERVFDVQRVKETLIKETLSQRDFERQRVCRLSSPRAAHLSHVLELFEIACAICPKVVVVF